MPSIDGELTLGVHDHFSLDPVELQLEQMPQLGGSRAYPDQPFLDCKSEKVFESANDDSESDRQSHTIARNFSHLITYLQLGLFVPLDCSRVVTMLRRHQLTIKKNLRNLQSVVHLL